MPRVSSQPRSRVLSGSTSTPNKTLAGVKIPLNDDRQEKANRLQSRQAQHEFQMSQIKAAATTPLRKRRSLLGQSPRTPVEDEDGMPSVSGTAVTPMKRVPILANFEEWMKMATDNKINATNSWNFALIDYFHDMSLLKEGDGVNFQRASCTLDGCVKIYTNRVDSVATETGKLLSGLADSRNKKGKDDGEEGEGEEDEDVEDDEEGGRKKSRKRTQRSAEVTLAASFSQLQLKKMELEFAVDPLFKKASADFDEGGAKGLLLNHLAIDGNGRIVFDSSDDTEDAVADDRRDSVLEDDVTTEEEEKEEPEQPVDIDVDGLAARFFPDLSVLDEQDICSALKGFELGDATGSLDLPFLKAPEDWRDDGAKSQKGDTTLSPDDEDAGPGADDDDDNLFGGLDLADDVGFGQGGEAWAKEAALEPQLRVHNFGASADDENDDGTGEMGGFDPNGNKFSVAIRHGREDEQENILNYFDKALATNWAGPEHWKIRRVKDATKTATPTTKRKEKEPFEIDFAAPMSQALADALYTPAVSTSSISLPKTQWRSRTRNLLPDDKHFNSRQLLRLFLKPKAFLASRKPGGGSRHHQQIMPEGEVDEQYWANKQQSASEEAAAAAAAKGDYDADFFQGGDAFGGAGMDDDDDEFADARDHFSPPMDGESPLPAADVRPSSQDGAFGAQLVTQSRRLRPEYVQYARVAKKVDVRRLKEEIWKGLAFEESDNPPAEQPKHAPDESLRFTDVINGLQSVYPKQAMADISTSFCFICVLHLANEKGLVIENQEGFTDLIIRKDHTAEIMTVDG